jgi:hypothetical protein
VVDDEASALSKVNEAVTPVASPDAAPVKAPKKKRSTTAPAAE